MKKKWVLNCGGMGLSVLACLAVFFYLPLSNYDASRVEPRLTALQTPYQYVKSCYYMDGGSIGIEITDRDGKTEQFALPAYLDSTNRYAEVYVGALYARLSSAVRVVDSEQTKRMLIHILATTPSPSAQGYEGYWAAFTWAGNLMLLRGHPEDYARFFFLKMKNPPPRPKQLEKQTGQAQAGILIFDSLEELEKQAAKERESRGK